MRNYVCGVVYRDDRGKYEFLVQSSINYRGGKPGKLQTKFLGGMQGRKKETLVATVQRELQEEGWFRTRERRKIMSQPDSQYPDQVIRHAFLVRWNKCTDKDNLRDVEVMDGKTLLFPPRWVSADEAEKQLHSAHRKGAFHAALQVLGLKPQSCSP